MSTFNSPNFAAMSPRQLTMASPVAGNHWNNNTIPTPSSTSGLPMTESALLAQDPFSAYVGLLANDANQAKKFLEVASTGQPAGNAELTIKSYPNSNK
jgi:hypothetical protein